MGVSIHYYLANHKDLVKPILDHCESVAIDLMVIQSIPTGIPFQVKRESENELYIDIGDCETLAFKFLPLRDLPDFINDKHFPFNRDSLGDSLVCWGFCKTQFAKSLVEHKWVADILAAIASRCEWVHVHDEGDYYHTGKLQDAAETIDANGKMIASVGSMIIGNLGFKPDDIIVGGETSIKPTKKRHA